MQDARTKKHFKKILIACGIQRQRAKTVGNEHLRAKKKAVVVNLIGLCLRTLSEVQ
jgi:hypothetical protein